MKKIIVIAAILALILTSCQYGVVPEVRYGDHLNVAIESGMSFDITINGEQYYAIDGAVRVWMYDDELPAAIVYGSTTLEMTKDQLLKDYTILLRSAGWMVLDREGLVVDEGLYL